MELARKGLKLMIQMDTWRHGTVTIMTVLISQSMSLTPLLWLRLRVTTP